MRRAGPADAAAIRDLTRSVYAKWIPAVGREPGPMEADYDHAVSHHWIDLLEEDGRLIALIETIPHVDHLFVKNVAVAEDRQGRGLARLLLDHAAAIARKHGLAELRLLTNGAFVTNLSLYRHLGFSVTREEPNPRGGTTVHFSKPVPGPRRF
jgi:ribosomal protein S18 acetylase RimI-like enzyme